MPFDKAKAVSELEASIGWRSYGCKHGESVFTKFFQNYYLPTKFGYDKRKPHLSSLIVSGQMTRKEALLELEKPHCDQNEIEMDITYLCKKLRINRAEFDKMMTAPSHHYMDFSNWKYRYLLLKRVQALLNLTTGIRISPYS